MSRYVPPPPPASAVPPPPPALAGAPVPPVEPAPGWGAFAGPLLAGAGGLWLAWQGLAVWGWDGGQVMFWGAVGAVLVGGRLWWVGTARGRALAAQDAYQRALERWLAEDLDARKAAHAAQTDALGRWADTVLGRDPREPAPALNPEAVLARQLQTALGAFRADLVAEVRSLVEAAQPVETARVANALQNIPIPIPEQPTTPLRDERGLLAAAYDNGPTWRLIAAAWRKDPITIRAMVTSGGWMTDDEWRALTNRLEGAGVLARKGAGPTAPFVLAAPYQDAPDEAACRAAVIDRLLLVGCGPGDLPGDLQAS